MEPIFKKTYHVPSFGVDRFQRMKLSWLLGLSQEVAGIHSVLLGVGGKELEEKHVFWALSRIKVQITRLPLSGEDITVETWPLPTTRVAFPRSTVAYDAQGKEVFRLIGLWVLMNPESRAMVLPGKSGISVNGVLRGLELTVPGSLAPRTYASSTVRRVQYTELDINGHMNNTRYLDWVCDLLPSGFHGAHTPREFTICYLSEIREGEHVTLNWELSDGPCLQVDAHRQGADGEPETQRAFTVQMLF